eukprot:UN12203
MQKLQCNLTFSKSSQLQDGTSHEEKVYEHNFRKNDLKFDIPLCTQYVIDFLSFTRP